MLARHHAEFNWSSQVSSIHTSVRANGRPSGDEVEFQIAFRNLEHRFRGVSGPRRPLAAPARLPKLPGASPDVMTAWVTHSHALQVF